MRDKIKISIDFDSTLSRIDVQEVVLSLIEKGFEAHITTTRHPNGLSKYIVNGVRIEKDNKDLYSVADKLNISHKNVHFTSGKDKISTLKEFDFLFHLDDDLHEINLINMSTTGIVGILCDGRNDWKKQIEEF